MTEPTISEQAEALISNLRLYASGEREHRCDRTYADETQAKLVAYVAGLEQDKARLDTILKEAFLEWDLGEGDQWIINRDQLDAIISALNPQTKGV